VCGAECYGENEAHVVIDPDRGTITQAFCPTCWPLVRTQVDRIGVVIYHGRL